MPKMIITADWHIRATRPRCRIDSDWMDTQRKALIQVMEISEKKKAPIVVVGDIFHSNSDTNFECINMVQMLAECANGLYILAGNHDLPYHSSENLNKSAIGVLFQSEKIFKIEELSHEFSAGNFDEERLSMPYMFIHTLTIPSKDKPDYIDCETPESLLKKYPTAKWIFTGDYHKNFHYEKEGRHVINSGCLLRQASDFKDYQCGVYFVDTDENIVEFIPIIDKEDLIDDSYIMQENERNERIESFVDKLKKTENVSLDFIENAQKEMKRNHFESDLADVVNELLEA